MFGHPSFNGISRREQAIDYVVRKVAATPTLGCYVANYYYSNLLKENAYYSIGLAIKKMGNLPSNEKSGMLMLLPSLCSDAPMKPSDAPQPSSITV
jgi:hypothetical protein